jgi:U3 small nucleolar RNA-associated protein 23
MDSPLAFENHIKSLVCWNQLGQHHSISLLPLTYFRPAVDSNHLRTIHAFKMPLHRSLEKTLHGKVKPFITKCTLASILQTTDLHTSQRPDFLPLPTHLPLRHCSHAELKEEGEKEGVLPEEECLLDLLRGGVTGNQQPKNKSHFVLATADPLAKKDTEKKKGGLLTKSRRPMTDSAGVDFRAQAREIPGVPIIYVKRSVMVLEELSGASLGVRRREEKDKFTEGILGMQSRKRKREEDDKENEGNDVDGKDGGEIEAIAPKKKMKKIRGPNPLSVLKKKPKPKNQPPRDLNQASAKVPSLSHMNRISDEEDQPRAKRKRKHSRKGKPSAGAASQDHEMSGLRDGVSDADEV